MIISALICLIVATYCFMNTMILAGLLCLAGIIPGPGMIPLLASSIILAVNGHYITAMFPVVIVIFNFVRASSALGR